jgi:hypothetical protein
MKIDTLEFFSTLAIEMNAHPERYRPLGEADMDVVIVMRAAGQLPFAVRLAFEGIRCEHVVEAEPDSPCEYRLDGPLAAWQAMFDDIVAQSRATGLQTINSLALLGNDIALGGSDPMGLDKFSRFNQTLQEFFDGASQPLALEVAP